MGFQNIGPTYWKGETFQDAQMGTEDFGLAVTVHAHAAGYVEFEDELETIFSD